MAAFYGTVKGNRGEVSRTSGKDTGISTTAQSYDGSVNVWMRYRDGGLLVDISIANGSSGHGERVFTGTVDELRAKLSE